jgi:hypothetical protein
MEMRPDDDDEGREGDNGEPVFDIDDEAEEERR